MEEHVNDDDVLVTQKVDKWWSIDHTMLSSKTAHFLAFAALGCFKPYGNIFFISVGLTYEEAGFISGICYVFSSISSPLWGFLTDTSGRRRLIFSFLSVSLSLMIITIPLTSWKIKADLILDCQRNDKSISYFNKTGSDFSASQDNTVANSTVSPSYTLCQKPFANDMFYAMLFLYSVTFSFITPVTALLDSFIMNVIRNNKEKANFGNQRVFGSIGWGITSFIAGIAADNYAHPVASKYSLNFYMSVPCIILLIPVTWFVLHHTNRDLDGGDDESNVDKKNIDILGRSSRSVLEVSKQEQISLIFSNSRNLLFFASILVVGITTNSFYAFYFILLDEEMKGNNKKTAMGLATFMSCFSEIFMFPFSTKIIRYLGSPLPCIEIGAFAFVIRFLLLSYIENAWLSVPVQVLHSLGFALLWAAAIEYVESIATKRIHSTMFGILNSIYYGLAPLIANMAGGRLYTVHGGRLLFKGIAVFTGVWVLVMFVSIHVIGCKDKPRETLLDGNKGGNDVAC